MARRKRSGRVDLSYRENLGVFLSCVEELRERPFILKGLCEFQFHVSFDDESGQLTCEIQEADQEHFRSFLLTFRKFILNDEPSNVDWVLNTCRRFVKDEEVELKEVLDELKAVWRFQYGKGAVRMHTSGLNLTPEYVLDLWINGQYFHGDNPDKRRQLNELLAQELPSVKIQLLWSLPLLTRIILRLAALVSKALEQGAFEFPEDAP
jgi:hypothetical protein